MGAFADDGNWHGPKPFVWAGPWGGFRRILIPKAPSYWQWRCKLCYKSYGWENSAPKESESPAVDRPPTIHALSHEIRSACNESTFFSLTSGMGSSSFRHQDQYLILIMNHPRWTRRYAYWIWTPLLFRSRCRFFMLF
jgi:hypothetical protein